MKHKRLADLEGLIEMNLKTFGSTAFQSETLDSEGLFEDCFAPTTKLAKLGESSDQSHTFTITERE